MQMFIDFIVCFFTIKSVWVKLLANSSGPLVAKTQGNFTVFYGLELSTESGNVILRLLYLPSTMTVSAHLEDTEQPCLSPTYSIFCVVLSDASLPPLPLSLCLSLSLPLPSPSSLDLRCWKSLFHRRFFLRASGTPLLSLLVEERPSSMPMANSSRQESLPPPPQLMVPGN